MPKTLKYGVPSKINGKKNPEYQRAVDWVRRGGRPPRVPKYGIPSKINGKRNPEYVKVHNRAYAEKHGKIRRILKPAADRGKKCAYCEVKARGWPVKNGVFVHAPRNGKNTGMFLCADCCPEGRITEPLRRQPATPVDILLRTRPLRQAYQIPDDQQEPISVLNIMRAISLLDNREQEILVSRFWKKESLADISKRIGVTRERVRQIQNVSLCKLRHPAKLKVIMGEVWQQVKFP